MRFTPKSANEIAEAGLLVEGEYDFEVSKAEDSTSKAGNEMIVLDLKVFDGQGGSRNVRDYLVSMDSMMRKIRSFAVCTGILDEYESGEFESSRLPGLTGRAKIKQDPANGNYEPKNSVGFYLDPEKTSSAPKLVRQTPVQPRSSFGSMSAADVDDEIPF